MRAALLPQDMRELFEDADRRLLFDARLNEANGEKLAAAAAMHLEQLNNELAGAEQRYPNSGRKISVGQILYTAYTAMLHEFGDPEVAGLDIPSAPADPEIAAIAADGVRMVRDALAGAYIARHVSPNR